MTENVWCSSLSVKLSVFFRFISRVTDHFCLSLKGSLKSDSWDKSNFRVKVMVSEKESFYKFTLTTVVKSDLKWIRHSHTICCLLDKMSNLIWSFSLINIMSNIYGFWFSTQEKMLLFVRYKLGVRSVVRRCVRIRIFKQTFMVFTLIVKV